MPERSQVVVRGLGHTYRSRAGSIEALAGIDADFAAGAFTTVVGPSGSGKSTLLRLLAGLDRPATGSIRAGTVELTSLTERGVRRFRRDTAAYVDQRPAANLIPHVPLRDQLGAAGVEYAERLGLHDQLHALAHRLSGGQQARAALAVALGRTTPILLADEPTAELDSSAAELVRSVLLDAAGRGRTVIVATHDPQLTAAGEATLDLADTHASLHEPAAAAPRRAGEETRIAATGLTKAYGDRNVLNGVTIDVRGGELAVVIGRSGSGKSTLLMILAGFLEADAGTVATPGSRWQQTAYLAQRFALLPELTTAENVELPNRLSGATDTFDLKALGLAGLRNRHPQEISIGQQQRTALARALSVKPAALLADEPTSHQDTASAAAVWRQLTQLRDQGGACLVATHDESAASHADRVWHIEDGAIV